MSSNNQSNINETFIIQPIYQQSDVISACTAVYTNNIFSCSGNTSISMSTNEVNFNNKCDINGNLRVRQVPEYASNAAALSAGLIAGAFYRTGEFLKVVY